MTRAEINRLVDKTNNQLQNAGKMFRIKTYNLIDAYCIFCKHHVVMEQDDDSNPICDKCLAIHKPIQDGIDKMDEELNNTMCGDPEEMSHEDRIQMTINQLDYERQEAQEQGNWEKAHSLYFRMAMLSNRL